MKQYNTDRMAKHRAATRGPEWKPKSTPRHAMLDCDGNQHRCTGCNTVKLVAEFPNNKETPCGYDPRCKACRHSARRSRMGAVLEKPRYSSPEEKITRLTKNALRFRLASIYRITEDQYNWLAFTQNYNCYLCDESDNRLTKDGLPYNLSVDHDHRCCEDRKSCGNCVRHLLCMKCNTMVGIVEAKPKLSHLMVHYINLRPLDNYPGEGNW